MPKIPDCKWAQRTDKILLTINVPNLVKEKTKVDITETSFGFNSEDFELKFDFFGTVNPDTTSWKITARDVQFVLMRKEEGEYWDKLQKGTKIHTLKVDWDKWKDEDEQADDDVDMSGFSGMDLGGMGGMGGMPGMGGMGGMPGMPGMGGMGGMGGMPGMGGMGGMGGMMGGMGGMPGMGDPDSDDDDDDDIPGLEEDGGEKKLEEVN